MPARDIFHHIVRDALEKDGWTITDDPLLLEYGRQELYIDLGAEKVLAAEKDQRRIAVEIKTFLGTSLITSFMGLSVNLLPIKLRLSFFNQSGCCFWLCLPMFINDFFWSH